MTPDGRLVGLVQPHQAASAGALVETLTDLFRKYRVRLFREELKLVLEDRESPQSKIGTSLKVIKEFLIAEADRTVAKLLKNADLSATNRKAVYDTLAVLSTQTSVEALLKHADEPAAEQALTHCTQEGAEYMLDALDPSDVEAVQRLYNAICHICQIKDAKSKLWWKNSEESERYAEVGRIKGLVRKAARHWRDENEALR